MERSWTWCGATLASLMLATGCDGFGRQNKPTDIRPLVRNQLCEDLKPLTTDEISAIKGPEGLLDLLPEGRTTPVALLAHPTKPGGPIGLGFLVHSSVARFTLHATQRELARLAMAKDATIPDVLLLPGPGSGQDRSCVAILTETLDEDTLLQLGGFGHSRTRRKKLVELLDQWRESAGMELAALGDGWAEIEIDDLPERPDDLIDDLVALTNGAETDRQAVKEELSLHRTFRLSL